jgi:hypothetical protein
LQVRSAQTATAKMGRELLNWPGTCMLCKVWRNGLVLSV